MKHGNEKNCCLETPTFFLFCLTQLIVRVCVWRDAQKTARTPRSPSGCHVLFNQHSPDILLTKATPGQDSVSASEEATVTAVCQQWRRTELLSL